MAVEIPLSTCRRNPSSQTREALQKIEGGRGVYGSVYRCTNSTKGSGIARASFAGAASKGSQPRKREGSPTSREGRQAGFWGHASRSDGAARPHRCGREEAEQWTPQKLAQSRLSPASSPRKGFARRRRGWGEPTDNARSGASFDQCRLLRIQDGGAHMLRGRNKPFTRRRYRRPYQEVHTVL